MDRFRTWTELAIVCALLAVVGCSKADDNTNNQTNDDHADAGEDAAHDHHDHDAAHEEPDFAGIDFGTVTITAEAKEYCDCLIITCHEPFHAKYGEDDAEAIAACRIESSQLPMAGSPQMSGNSIECRQYQCDNVGTDITCDDALGAACM